MAVRQNLIKLCEKIGGGHYRIDADCPEYQMFEQWITDKQIQALQAMEVMQPTTIAQVAEISGLPEKEAEAIILELAGIGIIQNVLAGGKQYYALPIFAPGIFEYVLINEEFCKAHPEIPIAFQRHATASLREYAPMAPMGAGVMRVIPVEAAIPPEATDVDLDTLSTYVETNASTGGRFCALPCQCRRVRRFMNEGAGDLEEGMCLFMGAAADMFLRKGEGKELTKEEAYEMLKHCEDIGCVHQITTLKDAPVSTVCNCLPESCLAIGAARYYNTPNMSRSNYVAEIKSEDCAACGQCVSVCPNNAVKLGQKIDTVTPIVHETADLPDDHEWDQDKWDPDYRDHRKNVVDTGTAPCKAACPAHIGVQGYIRLATQGKYLEALELIKTENPFPAICGRICPHDCEKECTRGEFDDPIAIDEIKKFIAEKELEAETRFIPRKLHDYGKQIAIIGAGPAGLSCAYYLAADGYKVTVFEKENKPGGMMSFGIPSFRLEKDVVNAEIDVLRQMGVVFKCGVEVGKDITLDELRSQGFEAFYIAIGAQSGRKLNIEGEDGEGVISGIEFLRDVNLGKEAMLSGNVIVIGGGNVAIDVARTAVRKGAGSTAMYCLENALEMPALPEEIEEANHEGVTINNSWGPKRIILTDGKVSGVEFKRCVSVFDENKRFSPTYDEKDTIVVPADYIILSIGQAIEWGGLLEGSKVELGRGNTANADSLTYQTAQEDVFVGGDVYSGPKFAIDAIAAGKEGAISIHRYVWEGQSLTIGRNRRIFSALDKSNIDKNAVTNSYDSTPRQRVGQNKEKHNTFKDGRITFTEEQLKKEASRCLSCGASVVDENRCLGCGVCTTRCKFDAIHLVKKFDAHSVNYFEREEAFEKRAEERKHNIAIRKAVKTS